MSKANLSRAGHMWAGTLDALNIFLDGVPHQQKLMMDKPLQEDEESIPHLLQIVGDTAIVNISGVLVTHDEWFNSFLGRVSYPEIRQAVMHSLTDDKIKRVHLMVDSGGGQVNGVTDLASFLTKAAKIKPMTAHTSGSMCSAAYWIASCAPTVTASDTSTVGSIGAVLVHTEISEMLKEEGVNVTVIRSGPYKYIGNMYEKLDETALAAMQGDILAAEGIFVKRIAANRGRGEDYVRTHMGQGRTFIGETAKDVGLVDGVYAYDDMMVKVLSGDFDNKDASAQNSILGGSQMNVQTNQATLQALAEQGINVEGVAAVSPDTEALKNEEVTPAVEAPEVEATETVQGEVEATEQDLSYIDRLEAKMEAKDETIINLKVETQAQAAKILQLEASMAPMKEIVTQVTERMAVGLGHSAVDFTGLNADTLLAQHGTLKASFSEKFKAGGVSSAQAQAANPAPQARSARQNAAFKSTKLA